ncbi:hypothetical protein H0R94_04460 [Treponema socranskii]|uniref:hypothetical protein n=1 Tax=Treponema socranskii TaxID=53419 RepID=UPI003D8CB473
MIDIVLYYAFYASAVLFYGIGLERTAALSVAFDKSVFRPALQCGVSALAATFLTELIAVHLLSPLGVSELYPLAALLVFAAVLSGIGFFMKTPSVIQKGECAASYLIVLLSLSESASPVDALIIAASCIFAFVLVLPVLSSLRYRIDIARAKNEGLNRHVLVMILFAILVIACAVWNVSWLSDYPAR